MRLSPDGRRVAYTSNESGSFDVYVTWFPEPGRKWPISSAGEPRGLAARRPRAVLSGAGRRFLVNVAVRATSPPATVIVNWPKTLGGGPR